LKKRHPERVGAVEAEFFNGLLELRLSQGRFCSGEVLRRQDVGDRLEWRDGFVPLMLVSSMGS
jgi:hypothetical protein